MHECTRRVRCMHMHCDWFASESRYLTEEYFFFFFRRPRAAVSGIRIIFQALLTAGRASSRRYWKAWRNLCTTTSIMEGWRRGRLGQGCIVIFDLFGVLTLSVGSVVIAVVCPWTSCFRSFSDPVWSLRAVPAAPRGDPSALWRSKQPTVVNKWKDLITYSSFVQLCENLQYAVPSLSFILNCVRRGTLWSFP